MSSLISTYLSSPSLHLPPLVTLYLVILHYLPLNPFLTRKLVHTGCGYMIMRLLPAEPLDRHFVYAVSLASILMTWLPNSPVKFRFTRPSDVGVTAYLLIVSAWFYLRMDPTVLGPVFFADPAGAVVGKAMSRLGFNARWHGGTSKTVLGTAAVFVVTYFTASCGEAVELRLGTAAAAAVVEG
eukprot:CAMPEP_0182454922 /NCGR_PEP_ID=MMETSP1319-20130603/1334_1 /TAXON_ID=172717 /ORGANISM="Bolidomonas pacifica, Strain RCC208" /LENGTH=182 /DNA_ID=CAMNT_0024652951 /DNA_START=48 /DNA_END=592 /DNA_ORIENTATION=-